MCQSEQKDVEGLDLQELREEIDGIDREIVKLYVRRMETAKAIGAWKRENGMPVYDPERERCLLDRVAAQAGPEYGEGVRALFDFLMARSRRLQMTDEDRDNAAGGNEKR